MKVNLIRVNGAMRIAFLLICYLATCVQLNAQAPKLVMGRILDKEASEKKRKPVPFDISSIGDIKIYYFNTVQEGKDMEAALNKDNISLTLSAMYEVPDATGAYQITLPETGSLVIKVSTAPAVFEAISGRREITTYVDMGHMISQVTVVGQRTEVTSMPETPDQYGDMIILNGAKVAVPPRIGKDNARMIVQPYVINNSKGKKVEMYRLPRVYDGSQYYLTQDRRMGYDITRDSLDAFIIETNPSRRRRLPICGMIQSNYPMRKITSKCWLLCRWKIIRVLIMNACWSSPPVAPDVRYVSSNIRSTSMNWTLRNMRKNRKLNAVPVWKIFL